MTTTLAEEYMNKPRVTGNIVKSSERLTGFLGKFVRKKKTVIEFGPGPGNVTKEIVKNLDKNSKLTCFEINKKFHNELKQKIKDKRVKIINDSAANVLKYCKNGDCIISTLPLLSLPKKDVDKIIENSYKTLGKDGIFVQIQYFYPFSLKQLKKYYSDVRIKVVVLNFPFPTFVFVCRKYSI